MNIEMDKITQGFTSLEKPFDNLTVSFQELAEAFAVISAATSLPTWSVRKEAQDVSPKQSAPVVIGRYGRCITSK